jgi:MFS family permease
VSRHGDGHALGPAERRRAFSALFTGVAVSTTGFLASNTVNGLIAEDLTGSTTWSGLPAAASVLGTAAGATLLAGLVRRSGPRTGLTLGYALAVAATGVAVWAIFARQFELFVATMFLFGVGYGANRLARYVAADLYPAGQRATMIGWIVWASTIGAIAGPVSPAPSRTLAEACRSTASSAHTACAAAVRVVGAGHARRHAAWMAIDEDHARGPAWPPSAPCFAIRAWPWRSRPWSRGNSSWCC